MILMAMSGVGLASVSVVSDGAGDAPAAIRIQSGIRKGDYAAFMDAVDRVNGTVKGRINGVPFITVELNSPGGDVVEALEIGRAIYQRYIMTVVRGGDECVSACVFILLAGAVHTPANSAAIGVHRPLLVSWRNMSATDARAKYEALMAYLRSYFIELGIDPAAYDLMMRTSSSGMHYLSSAELDRFRVRGTVPAWDRLYQNRWAAQTVARTAEHDDARRASLSRLPPIDPSWRTVVFMPGSGMESTYLPIAPASGWHLAWTDMDGDPPGTVAGDDLSDLATLSRLAASAVSRAAPLWWLILMIAFELVRPRGWPPRATRRDDGQWLSIQMDRAHNSPSSEARQSSRQSSGTGRIPATLPDLDTA